MTKRGLSYRRLIFPGPSEPELESFRQAAERGEFLDIGSDAPRSGPYLILGDGEFVYAGDDEILATEWLLGPWRLAELRRVSDRILRDRQGVRRSDSLEVDADWPVRIDLVDLAPEDFWPLAHDRPELYPQPEVTLEVLPTRVRAVVNAVTAADVSESHVDGVARRLCESAGADLESIEEAFRLTTEVGWTVGIVLRRRGATVRDLVELARSVTNVVGALSGPVADRRTVMNVIRAGAAKALVGTKESAWFEAKSRLWDLSSEAGRIELAQDVARFANADGGVIVVGAATRKQNGADAVAKVRGIAPDRVDLSRIRSSVDRRVFPVVDGLDVWGAEQADGRMVVVIEVPPQRDESKPYLVHGSIIDGVVEGAFFSIVRRRDDASITIDEREVHAWLAAGRQLLSAPAVLGSNGRPTERGNPDGDQRGQERRRLDEAKARELSKAAETLGRVVDDLLGAGEVLVDRMVADLGQWRRAGTFDAFRDEVTAWIGRCSSEGGRTVSSLVRERSSAFVGFQTITVIRRTPDDAAQLLDRMTPWLGLLRELVSLRPR